MLSQNREQFPFYQYELVNLQQRFEDWYATIADAETRNSINALAIHAWFERKISLAPTAEDATALLDIAI